jgi:glycolate oxidase FAD binding subunit
MIPDAPPRRVTPKSVADLAALLRQCDSDRQHLVVEGGNTLRGMGLPPSKADAVVVTTGLRRMLAHEFADLTASAQAGMTLGALGDALGAHGQFVPLDAPRKRSATIGGTLASGWLGPRRHRYGRARDYVIGSQIVLADGTIAKAGGMVVKNVTGYDMSKLYVGSFGTLGVLTQANFKTLPLHFTSRAFLARLPIATRSRAITQLQTLAAAPAAAFWVEGFHKEVDGDDGDDGRVVVLLEGSPALLERATRDLRSALGRAGVPETQVLDAGARECFERTVDAYIATIGERSVTYRIAALPETAEACALEMRELMHRFEFACDVLVDVMNGDVIVRASDRDARAFGTKIETFDDALHDAQPRAHTIAGDSPMRGNLNAWGVPPPAIEKMRAIKAHFDPNGTLNPGRFVGGI